MSAIERALIVRLVAVLAGTFTKAGHVAIRNEREQTGYCSHRRCAPVCVERRRLLVDVTTYLGFEDDAQTRAAS